MYVFNEKSTRHAISHPSYREKSAGEDHAGKWECSILSTLYPDALGKERIGDSDEWFIQDAVDYSSDIGFFKMIELSIEALKASIK